MGHKSIDFATKGRFNKIKEKKTTNNDTHTLRNFKIAKLIKKNLTSNLNKFYFIIVFSKSMFCIIPLKFLRLLFINFKFSVILFLFF